MSIEATMSETGQTLQVRCTPTNAQCPLRSESDRTAALPRTVETGHQQTKPQYEH